MRFSLPACLVAVWFALSPSASRAQDSFCEVVLGVEVSSTGAPAEVIVLEGAEQPCLALAIQEALVRSYDREYRGKKIQLPVKSDVSKGVFPRKATAIVVVEFSVEEGRAKNPKVYSAYAPHHRQEFEAAALGKIGMMNFDHIKSGQVQRVPLLFEAELHEQKKG